MSEKFCLKWNDFQYNVSNSFSLLRNEDYLHDVTIVTDENDQIAAHKLVLSACSEYFRNIFKKNKHSHPLLCLEGVSSKDVRNMMDYVYNGELQIFQEDLDGFLNVAQRLKIEGLITDPDDEEKVNNLEPKQVKTEKAPSQKIPSYQTERPERSVIAKINTTNSENFPEVLEQIDENIVRNADNMWECKACSRSFVRKDHLKQHIETHLEGVSFDCPMCDKTFRSRNSLNVHTVRFHKV